MSGRTGRSGPPPPPASNRQNEYFVPRDGIDREVITADICRYLGNDALVRPGVYESPQTGQVVQGYFITAYRNLTTAMIEDLKADSARWDQERRQQTARGPSGGTIASRDSNGMFNKTSNSAAVQYRNSDTHQSRQYYGPTEGSATAAYGDNTRDAYDSTPRYPGTGNAGYTGASGAYPAQTYGGQGGYGGQAGYASAPPPQFAQTTADTYPGGATMAGSGFGPTTAERPYTQPVNMTARGALDTPMYGASDPYQTGARDRLPASTVSQSRSTYVTSGPPAQQSYTQTTSGYYGQNPASATSQFAPVQPQDPFYGRGSPAGNPSYGTSHEQQYDTNPTPRTSAPSSNTQMATSGSSSSRRDARDSVDRTHTDSRSRHHRR